MKILYVDLQHDYGDIKRGFNQIGEIGFHQVFKKLGHDVTCFYYDEYLKKTKELQGLLLAKADEVKPDLIFFCLYTNQFQFETLDILKSKYKTMNWFGDDQWRFDGFTSKYAPYFTYNVTTDLFSLTKYSKLGCKKVLLSQWAALNIEDVIPEHTDYAYDVSFVGGFNSARKWFIDELENQGIRVDAFGNGWPNGALSLSKMTELFQKSRINLNLSNSVTLDLRYLTHHYKNPIIAWKSKKSSSQIKARNFEIPYSGGFQLTDYVPTIEKYFELSKEIACYSNVDEAALLIKYYLENTAEREQIKAASVLRARNQHTYLNRFQEIFAQL